MNIEEFRNIKQQMFYIAEKYESASEQEAKKLINQFYNLQMELLSNDLSQIPFEEWKEMALYSKNSILGLENGDALDDVVDLSKTRANIDFDMLGDIVAKKIILGSCNVRGVENINYDENTFDDEFAKSHSELFASETVAEEIRRKFYENKLEFSDLLENPSLRDIVKSKSFGMKYNASCIIIDAIGFENAMKIFDENPGFISWISSIEGLRIYI